MSKYVFNVQPSSRGAVADASDDAAVVADIKNKNVIHLINRIRSLANIGKAGPIGVRHRSVPSQQGGSSLPVNSVEPLKSGLRNDVDSHDYSNMRFLGCRTIS